LTTSLTPVPATPLYVNVPSATDLGPLAWAVEAAPVSALTTAGILLGGGLGAGAGWLAATLLRSGKAGQWALAAGLLGSAAAAVEGYREGQELSVWLADHK
jgi:hypothetical protein